MTLLLHAITPRDVAPPDGLAALLGTELAVVHAEVDEVPEAERAAVLRFGRAVQEVADRGPVLPVRFGTSVRDLPALAALVAEHEAEWLARLRAVAGCCELIVHLDREPSVDPTLEEAPLTGRDYLMRRAAAVRSVDTLRAEVDELLRPVAREVRTLPAGRGHDRLAVLVPRAAAEPARADVRRWAAGHPDVTVAVTGPWPPFSFGGAPA